MEVKEERFVSWVKAKKILEKKGKEKELGYEQKNALEFLRKFSKTTDKKSNELMEELSKISKLKEKHLVAILDMLPENEDDLKTLFANEIIALTPDDRKKILAAVKKFT